MSMGPILDTTVKGTSANSFITVMEADSYHEGRFHNGTNWFALSDGDKAAVLVWATRLLSRLEWKGYRTTTTQKLAFPRSGLEEDKQWVDHDTIPDRIKEVTAELAYWLSTSDRMNPETGGVVQKLSLGGSLEVVFDTEEPDPLPIPKEVMNLLGDWAVQYGAGYQPRLVRV